MEIITSDRPSSQGSSMRNSEINGTFPTRLWVGSVVAIVAIVLVGVIINRSEGNSGSPIAARLAAAAVVTALAAIAKIVAGPRAAAVTAVVGTAIAVAVLNLLA
jgi:type VI protein secretion system component VasK